MLKRTTPKEAVLNAKIVVQFLLHNMVQRTTWIIVIKGMIPLEPGTFVILVDNDNTIRSIKLVVIRHAFKMEMMAMIWIPSLP